MALTSCFTLSFEIFFSSSDEFTNLIYDLSGELGRRGKVIALSSGIIFSSKESLLQISFSEETSYAPQIMFQRSFFRAIGRLSCTDPMICGEIYEIIYTIVKNRRLRIRLIS